MKFQILATKSDPLFKHIKTDLIQFNVYTISQLLIIFLIAMGLDIFAQVVFDHPVATGAATNYSTTWTVPAGINAITVEAWGGGAGGNGNIALPPQMFVGGGGGAYAKVLNYSVTPGDVLTIDIGRGGPITTGTNPNLGSSGGNTTVSKAGTVLLSACGGAPYYVIAGNYVSAACSPVNVIEYGINTYTTSGGNAGGLAFGGGLGGALGQVGIVPGGGGSGSFGVAKAGASGRVIINTGQVTINCDVTINPSSASICNGQSVSLSANGADSFTWSSEPGLSATSGSTVSANPTQTTTYTVTGTTGNCSSTRTVTITVNQSPTVTINPSSASICSGLSTSLTANGATSYTWSNEPGLSASSGTTVSANPTQTTTYTVTGTTGSCSSTRTVTITVNQSPTVTINPSAVSICSGQSTSLTANGADSFAWSSEPGLSSTSGSTVSANPTQTTTYTVTGTTGNCSSNSTVTITVKQLPVLDISPRAVTICIGEFASLQASGASTYSWAPASGLSATTGALVSASPDISTSYTVTGITNGCSSTDSILVTVNFPPSSDFSFTQTGDYTIDFVNNSENAISYQWIFMTDSNSTETNPSFTFPAPGNYPVELIATNACGSDTSRQIINIVVTSMFGVQNQEVWQIYPNPTADFTVLRNNGLLLDAFSVEIYNDQGQMVDSHIANPSNKVEILLDFSEYKAGIYLIYLSGKQGNFAKKIIRL